MKINKTYFLFLEALQYSKYVFFDTLLKVKGFES